MPHSISAKKRVRQNERHRAQNKAKRSEIRSWIKKTVAAISEGKAKEAQSLFQKTCSLLDKAAKTRIYHKNTVARRKSGLAKALNQAQAAKKPA